MCSLVVGIEHGARSPQTVAERETTSSRTALVRRTLNFRGCPSVRTEACCTSVTSRPARWSRGTRRYLHATLKAPAPVRDPSSSSIVSSSTLPGAPSEALEMANIPKSTCPEVSPLEISKATSPMSHENRLISSQATKRWVPRLPPASPPLSTRAGSTVGTPARTPASRPGSPHHPLVPATPRSHETAGAWKRATTRPARITPGQLENSRWAHHE